MLSFLPSPLKGLVSGTLFVLNTAFWSIALYVFAAFRFLIPIQSVQKACSRIMVKFAETWISGNSLNMALTQSIKWRVTGTEDLEYDRSYLVCANHQSWTDIVVLQQIFNRRIPFLRFFLKQELLYVPLLGGAWWALDFPFMKRYSKEYLEKHPEKRGEDLETTRRACEKFRNTRTSILNFLEGTRLTPAKHAAQKSPYANLLKPKSGGIAFVLEAMGEQFDSLLDVTIFYPKGAVSLWGALSGKLSEVVVIVRRLPIPTEFLSGGYLDDERLRENIQNWVRDVWVFKDELLTSLKDEVSANQVFQR